MKLILRLSPHAAMFMCCVGQTAYLETMHFTTVKLNYSTVSAAQDMLSVGKQT